VMKFSAAFGLLNHFRAILGAALLPTLRAVFYSPSLLLRPHALSHIFMSHAWGLLGVGVDENSREVKEELVKANAYGVVLDIGAGHGHLASYLDRAKVTKYVAVEPNANMHQEIRSRAKASGFDEDSGTLLILPYGAEAIPSLVSALGGPHTVDCIVSIMAFCSISNPQRVLQDLVDVLLKSGGEFLFYEHVLSHRSDVAWWQRFWSPLWSFALDGCRLDCPTHLWVEKMDIWKEKSLRGTGEDEENLFWHQIGRFVKA